MKDYSFSRLILANLNYIADSRQFEKSISKYGI
jgi:hypothetical protein